MDMSEVTGKEQLGMRVGRPADGALQASDELFDLFFAKPLDRAEMGKNAGARRAALLRISI
jgi:hypothetical protein